MADSAADVPLKYDCLIDGNGFVFWKALMPNMPFRVQRAGYSYYPTFLDRTNVSGNYGDDAQAFWLTASQNDWSEGENRRYFRSTDADVVRRYWQSDKVDVTKVPGQFTLRKAVQPLTFASNIVSLSDGGGPNPILVCAATSTNLYTVAVDGTSITDKGAHGLGVAPGLYGITGDSLYTYVSSSAGGTVGVRRLTAGGVWSTWSVTGCDTLAFLNNTLFGFSNQSGQLIRYDTTGTPAEVYVWQAADGATGAYGARIRPYGGHLLILRQNGDHAPSELWEFDGTGVDMLASLPSDFTAKDLEVVSGVVFISGTFGNDTSVRRPAIYYYANGEMGRLWQAQTTLGSVTCHPAMTAFGEGIVFSDDTTGRFMLYNIAYGGVQGIGDYTVTNTSSMVLASNQNIFVHTRGSTAGYFYSDSTGSINTSGYLISSLYDFDNSLDKIPRGIKVVFDSASDGDGGSVDIAYQFDSVDGSWTNLQTGAVSGTEYTLPSTTAHSIAVKLTVNKGSSTAGPKVKHLFLRGIPLLNLYRRSEFILDCTGRPHSISGAEGASPKLNNGNDHHLTGLQMVTNLFTSIAKQTPVTVTDRFGTYSAVFLQGPEVTEIDEVRPEEYIAKITVRQV